jgi:PAS domain S-box-containing protein
MASSAFVWMKRHILVVNRKCLEVLDMMKEELIGENWFDMCIPSEINAQVKQAYSKVMSGEMEREILRNEVVTKSGTRKLIYWNNALIKDEVGQIKELLCSGIDITERKHSRSINKSQDEFR